MKPALLLLAALSTLTLPQGFCQSYGNQSYAAVASVDWVQALPRLDAKLSSSSKEFDIDRTELRNEYTTSVIVFPCLLVCVCLLVMVMMTCCWCSALRSTRNSYNNIDGEASVKEHTQQQGRLKQYTCTLYLYLLLFLLSCQGLVLVIFKAQSGTVTSIAAIDTLHETALDLQSGGINLDLSGNLTFASVEQAIPVCPTASPILEYQLDYQASINSYLELIDPVPSASTDLQDFLEEWGSHKMSRGILLIYIISIILTFPIVVGQCVKFSSLLRFSIIVGYLMLLGLLASWCLFLIGLVS